MITWISLSSPFLLINSVGNFQCHSNSSFCFDNFVFYFSFSILVAEILCYWILQPLLENTKDKLSQFCHVPVSFPWTYLGCSPRKLCFVLLVTDILLHIFCMVSHRLIIFWISMMYQIFGMFPSYLGWVSNKFLVPLKLGCFGVYFVYFYYFLMTGCYFQNQNAHHSILQQLNLLRWVFYLSFISITAKH